MTPRHPDRLGTPKRRKVHQPLAGPDPITERGRLDRVYLRSEGAKRRDRRIDPVFSPPFRRWGLPPGTHRRLNMK